MKKLLLFVSLLPLSCLLSAQETVSLARLREAADAAPEVFVDGHLNATEAMPGETRRALTVTEDWVAEGIVVSDYRNENLDFHYQKLVIQPSSSPNSRCAYLESPDGRYGLRLNFIHSDDHKALARGSRVRIALKGATLAREESGYIVTGLTAASVLSAEAGRPEDIPVKLRRVRELTDEDLFTQVTIPDCGFVFKHGSYLNIRESYVRKSSLNAHVGANNIMDGWARLMADTEGNPFYLLLNTLVPWRRDGTVPAGTGTVTGILVKTYNPRYGHVDGYGLRPLEKDDVKISRDPATDPFKTLAAWNWNIKKQVLDTESGPVAKLTTERVPAEVGAGFLSMDVPGVMVRMDDYDNPDVDKSGTFGTLGTAGALWKGAVQIQAPASAWWDWEADCGRSLIVELSMRDISGSRLYLAWTFSAGRLTTEKSYDYPAFWNVEYSTDGTSFRILPGSERVLRSLPFAFRKPRVHGSMYFMPAETGLGYTEHLVRLPAFLLGQERVVLRISPSRKVVASLGYLDQDRGALRKGLMTPTYVNFGEIAIRYQ